MAARPPQAKKTPAFEDAAFNPHVTAVRFIKSAAARKDWPDPNGLPEIAVAGRSNVGKSSLINRLVNRHRMARVSNTPGRTQLLNFFEVNGTFVLCDLPGYGFAKVPNAVKDAWGPMIEGYLADRRPLRALLLLLDCRREPGEWETSLVTFCSERGLVLVPVVTKIDKVSKSQRFPTLARIGRTLGVSADALVGFSAENGEGLQTLWQRVSRVVETVSAGEGTDSASVTPAPARLRPLKAADAEGAALLSADAGAARWDAAAFRRELELPQATLTALDVGGALRGFMVHWKVVDELQLLNVVVDAAERRRGHGRRLMQALLSAAEADADIRAVSLEVRAGNAPAIALYESFGFETVGRRRRYYADGEDALLMERAVSGT